jgi:hypothetical protein
MNRILIAFVLLASTADACLTDAGLRLHLIDEANPLMRFVYDHSFAAFYACKILLPLSLFFLAAKVRKRVLITGLFRLSVAVYAGILLLHYYWLSVSIGATA